MYFSVGTVFSRLEDPDFVGSCDFVPKDADPIFDGFFSKKSDL